MLPIELLIVHLGIRNTDWFFQNCFFSIERVSQSWRLLAVFIIEISIFCWLLAYFLWFYYSLSGFNLSCKRRFSPWNPFPIARSNLQQHLSCAGFVQLRSWLISQNRTRAMGWWNRFSFEKTFYGFTNSLVVSVHQWRCEEFSYLQNRCDLDFWFAMVGMLLIHWLLEPKISSRTWICSSAHHARPQHLPS